MRSEATSGNSPLMPTRPRSAADWIGDSGGTYHTIGSVRYSGCSGNASFQSIAILYTGDALAASSQLSEMPYILTASITFLSNGSMKISRFAWYKYSSAGNEAATWIRSASYSITPK